MIVVTTPTGNIGRQVVDLLLAAGAPVRVIARDPSSLPPAVRASAVVGSHGDPSVVRAAFEDADAVLWIAPPGFRALSLHDVYAGFTAPACAAFTDGLVGRVVAVSALGRGTRWASDAGLVTASLAMDDAIMATGVPYRSLALPSFMDNVLRQANPIATEGRCTGVLDPDRRLPLAATRDIAAVAAALLLDGSWTGQSDHPVLGPEDLSHADLAKIMSEVVDRPVEYAQVTADAFRTTLLSRGASPAVADGTTAMMVAKNAGLDNGVSRTPEWTTPTSFREWCESALLPAVQSA
ncbi:NAD(P)H-binding protein [Dactylosporangium sucinum]|uniref:NmrA family transcriptional regulator n=1 Tax=Dactylosporangium sucinum TaxID=1424081 RepID=A0A917X6Z8_9ACTN|nr:NAD(P)H-binding protein [Dactylosporangium sucinum]GGM79074.1 NmrA family transcriptional regulator [Dactylosporangium sucinum]